MKPRGDSGTPIDRAMPRLDMRTVTVLDCSDEGEPEGDEFDPRRLAREAESAELEAARKRVLGTPVTPESFAAVAMSRIEHDQWHS